MRVLVCGGRAYPDYWKVHRVLDELHGENPRMDGQIHCIIHGGAGKISRNTIIGADLIADQWALLNWVGIDAYPVSQKDWKTLGPRAGPIRNARMLSQGRPDLVVAFPGGRGTADMVSKARAAGVPVQEVA